MIERGVSKFDGAITTKWYGWAHTVGGKGYKEGPLRFFKWRAWLDARSLKP